MWVQSLGWEDPLEKGMATHSSILAWEIPWTEETGRLESMGSRKSPTQLRAHTFFIYLSLALLSLRCCVAFSYCGNPGLLLLTGHRLLIAVASFMEDWASVAAPAGLNSFHFQALEHRFRICGATT